MQIKLNILKTVAETCDKDLIQYSKLCFLDMKIMSLSNGGNSVNNSSCDLVVYPINSNSRNR